MEDKQSKGVQLPSGFFLKTKSKTPSTSDLNLDSYSALALRKEMHINRGLMKQAECHEDLCYTILQELGGILQIIGTQIRDYGGNTTNTTHTTTTTTTNTSPRRTHVDGLQMIERKVKGLQERIEATLQSDREFTMKYNPARYKDLNESPRSQLDDSDFDSNEVAPDTPTTPTYNTPTYNNATTYNTETTASRPGPDLSNNNSIPRGSNLRSRTMDASVLNQPAERTVVPRPLPFPAGRKSRELPITPQQSSPQQQQQQSQQQPAQQSPVTQGTSPQKPSRPAPPMPSPVPHVQSQGHHSQPIYSLKSIGSGPQPATGGSAALPSPVSPNQPRHFPPMAHPPLNRSSDQFPSATSSSTGNLHSPIDRISSPHIGGGGSATGGSISLPSSGSNSANPAAKKQFAQNLNMLLDNNSKGPLPPNGMRRTLNSMKKAEKKASTIRGMVPLNKHATISAPAGDTLADKERKQRVHIADEITNTEREYYKDLDFTIIYFLTPLREQLSATVSPKELEALFGNIEEVKEMSGELLREFTAFTGNNPDEVSWGKIFLDHANQLEVYDRYCSNTKTASDTLELLHKRADFKSWVAEVEDRPECRSLTLESFLIKPFQRVMKYPLLLKSFLDAMPKTDPEYLNIVSAVRQINGLIRRTNEKKRIADNLEKMIELQQRFIWSAESPDLRLGADPNRLFICEEQVKVWEGNKFEKRCVLLFNDLLLVAANRSKRLIFKMSIPADKCIVWNMNEFNGKAVSNVFSVLHTEDTKLKLIIRAESEIAKQTWITNINECIANYLN